MIDKKPELDKRQFAATARASDGRQVLVYVEMKDDEVVLNCVAYTRWGGIIHKRSWDLTPEHVRGAYLFVEIFDTQQADILLSETPLGGV